MSDHGLSLFKRTRAPWAQPGVRMELTVPFVPQFPTIQRPHAISETHPCCRLRPHPHPSRCRPGTLLEFTLTQPLTFMPWTHASMLEFSHFFLHEIGPTNRLLDNRLVIIDHFAASYDTLTDARATELARRFSDFKDKRVKPKRTGFRKSSKMVPANKMAKFFPIENQSNAAMDLQPAAAIPLIR